ncbi:MAG: thioesterase domain-containing protein [Clostridiales bacterium]|nr:thioesterase domain-containing protein [Clostridiales bacterium]
MGKTKLFCLPYAGGSATIYFKWKIEGVDVVPLEYAGRGIRGNLPFCESFEDLVEDVFKLLKGNLQENDKYAIFGHSLGALAAYDLYRKIAKEGLALPQHVFLSAAPAPDQKENGEKISHLTDQDFVREVRKFGGIPDEILDSKDFAEYFLIAIRADFHIYEKYCFTDDNTGMRCPVTVFFGEKDSIGYADVLKWRKYAFDDFTVESFDGDHFFVVNEWQRVVAQIGRRLCW